MNRHAAAEVPDDSPEGIRIVSGSPTPEELAAITAVVHSVAEELEGTRRAAEPVTVSAWERSARPVRVPIVPGPGRWRGFSG